MVSKINTPSFLKATALGVAVSALSACGIDAPKAEIAYAEATLQAARNLDANRYAGVELERAKGKLQQAKSEMQEGNNEKALRLANEASATGSLAQTKAEAGRAKTAEGQMQESLQMLKSQLQ